VHKDDGKVEEVPALLNLCRLESQGMKGAFIASNQARSSQAKNSVSRTSEASKNQFFAC
jgi:hypothetical protein